MRTISMAVLMGLAILVSGCATCQRYPVPCMVVSAVVVGSVAATIEANRADHRGPNAITGVRPVVHQ